MSFLLKDSIHNSIAESVYNEILSQKASYYYFIGKVIDWADTNVPETPTSTWDYEYQVRKDIISVKKIGIRDASLVVSRYDWVEGDVYDQYDNNYSSSNPSDTGAESIKEAKFYVLASSYNVYKCLYNNQGAASTIEPSGTDVIPVTYSDGYVWKYLYTIPLSLRNRFLTPTHMPVQQAVNNTFYSNGEIDSVVIDSFGSGYSGQAEVTLSVTGTFLGLSGNANAVLRPVVSDTGQILDVIIESPGNNYSNATIIITDNLYTGTSYYKGVSNVRIYDVGTGYTTAAQNNTTVEISTTGSSQPDDTALVRPVYSNEKLVGIDLVNPGSGYTTSVKNNTSVVISTTGLSQPTSNATANIFYTGSAILTPVLKNGRIDRVLINDPGDDYSSNNQTTISTIGDGTGAVLIPVINSAGELSDVIVQNRGTGYTYLDVEVVGGGTGANAYVNISDGDLSSDQGVVELSAINGAIYSIKVDNAGQGYTNANVILHGDGINFIGNAVIEDNSISQITVVAPGYGYTHANITITGNGSNAAATAIISPPGGHGKNAVKELFADTIMLYSTINNEKNQGITVNNDYRQFGLLKNIKQFGSNLAFTNSLGSTCYLLTCNTVTGLNRDDVLTITSNDVEKEFVVIEVITGTNQLLLINNDNFDLETGDILYNEIGADFTVTQIDSEPDINKFSGDMLYIDNRTTVSYSDQQLVTIRTIIQL